MPAKETALAFIEEEWKRKREEKKREKKKAKEKKTGVIEDPKKTTRAVGDIVIRKERKKGEGERDDDDDDLAALEGNPKHPTQLGHARRFDLAHDSRQPALLLRRRRRRTARGRAGKRLHGFRGPDIVARSSGVDAQGSGRVAARDEGPPLGIARGRIGGPNRPGRRRGTSDDATCRHP